MSSVTTPRLGAHVAAMACIAVLVQACAFPPSIAESRAWSTTRGARFEAEVVAPGAVRVLVFTTTDCPIANSYAPLLVALDRDWRAHDVEIVLVHVDADATAASVHAHASDYALPFPIVLDAKQELAMRYGVTTTPEVAVLTRDGMQYRGRIDDRWRGRGIDSQTAESHDLKNAVDALLAGELPAVARTEPVGCRLPALP